MCTYETQISHSGGYHMGTYFGGIEADQGSFSGFRERLCLNISSTRQLIKYF